MEIISIFMTLSYYSIKLDFQMHLVVIDFRGGQKTKTERPRAKPQKMETEKTNHNMR
jgi:hypothetical protein